MDIDHQDDSDFEPSEEDGSQTSSTHGKPASAVRSDNCARASGTRDLSNSRWERLQPYYSDRYLELFHETFQPQKDDPTAFETSQLGAVRWHASEKAKLFAILPKSGRHDLPRAAKYIGTKSELEVKAYLDFLRAEETDRQEFEKQTKNASRADVLAAIEVGPDLEARLEKAADALAAFQDQYDLALAQQSSSSPVVITHEAASMIDAQTETELDEGALGQRASQTTTQPHQELFKFASFLELSEKLFMHDCHSNPKTHWNVLAEHGESPGMTMPVFTEFYDLVTSILQRVIQTTIFLAESRIRASTSRHENPRREVKTEDVHSALQILKIENDYWEYWIRLPRRAEFKIVAGSKRKGDSVKHIVSYDEVEAALSIRHHAGRRRSLSITSQSSGSSLSAGEETGSDSRSIVDDRDDSSEDEASQPSGAPSPSTNSGDGDATDAAENHPADVPRRYPLGKRKRQLEQELDEYMEILDGHARQTEDARIRSQLGFDDSPIVKEEDIELGRRPKVLRKSAEEVQIWKQTYLAEWEAYPQPLLSANDQAIGPSDEG
jgi:RNA polymerase I-specific transcription initiation factor RRN5